MTQKLQFNSPHADQSLPLITHVCKHFYPVYGGLERFVHQLITSTRSGYRHQVVCYNDDLDGNRNHLEPATVWDGIPIFRVPCFKAGWFHTAWLPAQVLNGSDLIHVHSMDLLLDQVICRFSAKPIVASTHGLIFHHQKHMAIKTAYLKLVSMVRGNNPDIILASGQTDFDFSSRFFPAIPVQLIPNPVQFPSSLPDTLPGDRQGVISLFRFQKNKAPETVLSVYHELRKAGYSEPLMLVLSGETTPITGWLHYHHHVLSQLDVTVRISISEDEKWRLLTLSSWLIHPSGYEGFGYTVAEGLIAGCQVLVSPAVYRNFETIGAPYIRQADFGQADEVARLIIIRSSTKEYPRFSGYTGWHWDQRSHEFSAIYQKYTQS